MEAGAILHISSVGVTKVNPEVVANVHVSGVLDCACGGGFSLGRGISAFISIQLLPEASSARFLLSTS